MTCVLCCVLDELCTTYIYVVHSSSSTHTYMYVNVYVCAECYMYRLCAALHVYDWCSMGCVLCLLCAMCASMMKSALLSTVSSLLSVMCVVHGTGGRLYATCN